MGVVKLADYRPQLEVVEHRVADTGREVCRHRYPDPECPAGNIIYTLLDWASNEGFWQVIREITGEEYASPAQYRQRYLLAALKERGFFNGS